MTQLVITNIEEDILASLVRNIQNRLSEVLSDVEAQTCTKNELLEKVKAVERQLKSVTQTLR